jgi:chromosomal replication initiator protein
MFTSHRWILTPENRSAASAILAVADDICSARSRSKVNPLFLHGLPGTGKTYLVASFLGEVYRRAPDHTIRVLSSLELPAVFRPEHGTAAYEATGEALESLLRCDILVVEDLQHLRSEAADGLSSLFDRRLARHGQMIFTASVGPAQLTGLPARLTSRMAGGLVVSLSLFSPESRLLFLTERACSRQLALGNDVLRWLAKRLAGSARQLEGALDRVKMYAQVHQASVDIPTVATLFRDESAAASPTVERIADRVSSFFHVGAAALRSRRRVRHALLPRQVGMYLTRRLTKLSLESIGAYFGGRDHSTVLHACRKVEKSVGHDASLSSAVRQLCADLG